MIEVKNLTKTYYNLNKSCTVLHDINYRFPNTGLVAIYGENGCGKTTFLNILATIDEDYKGSVHYNMQNYRNVLELLRRNEISYIFQDDLFVDYLNVEQNLLLFSEKEDGDEVQLQLKQYDIAQKKDLNAVNLSGGQRQRASFIRGILKKSNVLLVDEPTSGMNEEMEKVVFEKLKLISYTKLVILVSHNVDLIRYYSDIIIHIEKGKIISSENNFTQGCQVKFHKDYVEIPTCNFDLGKVDKYIVRERLEKDKKITFHVVKNELPKKLLDYQSEELKLGFTPKDMKPSIIKDIIVKSFFYSKFHLLFMGIMISIFSVLFTFLLSFKFYDKNKFIFQSLVENVGEEINYRKDRSISNNEKVSFNQENYMYVKNQLNEDIQIFSDFEYSAKVNFNGEGIYNERIYGFVYYDENNFELLYGKDASLETVLITDYLADGFVRCSNKISSYEDLINIGIIVNSSHLTVSGVIKTNYKKYLDCYMLESFKHSQEYIDYLNDLEYWGHLFYPYNYIKESVDLYRQPINNGEFLADFQIATADLSIQNDQSGCYINSRLAADLKECNEIKTSFGLTKIEGVVEDGNDENIIYVSSTMLDKIRIKLLNELEHLRVKVSNQYTIEYLGENGLIHATSISSYIIKTLEVINLLNDFFSLLLLFGVIFITLTLVYAQIKFIGKDNKLISIIRMVGYSRKYTYLLEIFKMTIIFVILGVSNVVFFIGSVYLINLAISKIFNMAIKLANVNFIAILITLSTLYFLLLTITLLICCKKSHISIKKLIAREKGDIKA